jgi:hypothetical protein
MDDVWHTRRPASGLCYGLELSTDTIEMLYTTTLIIRIHNYYEDSPEMFEKWNYSTISDE